MSTEIPNVQGSISAGRGGRLQQLSAVDLFAGCGGLTYGLQIAGFLVKGAVEIDSVAAATYQINHPNVAMLTQDIRKVEPNHWMTQIGLRQGELDLLAGCPPCQGFSVLRTRNGARRVRDKQNRLILELLRFIPVFLPRTIMLENVPGLKDRSIFKTFCDELKRFGYFVLWRVEDARFHGVPQRRRRLILLAGRGIALGFPARSRQFRTVRQTIDSLPQPGFSGDLLHDYPEKRDPKTALLIAKIPRDGGGRLMLPKTVRLPCHRNFNGFKDVYGRLRWDDVAPTITTGCYNPSKGRFLHPTENRCITMREAALLQSFPRAFTVAPGTRKTQAARMLGNALPPEFVRRHALVLHDALIKTLGESDTRARNSLTAPSETFG